jgi:Mn2+/Fe2+ NRAMP family transporter
MMVAVVYLSSKLGQVTGEGLFAAIRSNYSARFLRVVLIGVVIGNTIEAGADLGGIAAALHLFIPVPQRPLVILVASASFLLQVWGSYRLISNIFRILSLCLLAYVVSIFLAHPDLHQILLAVFRPHFQFDRASLSMLVAMIGTALSAYLFTWQSNEEVEEKRAAGRVRLRDRRGTTNRQLHKTLLDVLLGMFFSSLVCTQSSSRLRAHSSDLGSTIFRRRQTPQGRWCRWRATLPACFSHWVLWAWGFLPFR